jgi:hypothetical protein
MIHTLLLHQMLQQLYGGSMLAQTDGVHLLAKLRRFKMNKEQLQILHRLQVPLRHPHVQM